MTDRDIFAEPSMQEHIEMLRDDINALAGSRCPEEKALEAAGFLVEESHTKATSLLVLSRHLAGESASLLAHLNSLKY